MAEFYVELKENEVGAHVIHFSTCSDLPQAEQVKYLGSIATFDSANKKGNRKIPHYRHSREGLRPQAGIHSQFNLSIKPIHTATKKAALSGFFRTTRT